MKGEAGFAMGSLDGLRAVESVCLSALKLLRLEPPRSKGPKRLNADLVESSEE